MVHTNILSSPASNAASTISRIRSLASWDDLSLTVRFGRLLEVVEELDDDMANGEDGIGLLFGGDINARDTDENAAANATSRDSKLYLAMVEFTKMLC